MHDAIENCCGAYVEEDAADVIVDRIFALSDDVGEHHRCAVAGNATPCASHVTILRNEDDIDQNENETAGCREPSAVYGLVDELVPEREIEIDTHHNLCRHHDRHDAKSLMVTATDDVLQQRHIAYDAEEGKEGEDDEILHCGRVVFLLVAIL